MLWQAQQRQQRVHYSHNAQTAIPIRNALEALGHPQPLTPLKIDNTTANAFVHQDMRHKKSRA